MELVTRSEYDANVKGFTSTQTTVATNIKKPSKKGGVKILTLVKLLLSVMLVFELVK